MPERRLFVLPYPHPHYLSQALIDDIKIKKSDAYLGCTHRVTSTAFEATFEDARFNRGKEILVKAMTPPFA